LEKIRGKKFTTLFLFTLLCFGIVAGLFKTPLISIPEVHATGVNSSLVGNLETIVNAVNYTSDIDAIYQGIIVGETSMQQLINAYNALTNPTTILQWTPILSKLGYANQTTIEWALDNQPMMSNGLPNTGADSLSGSSQAFLVYDRFLILAYGYAIQYNYDLSTWNLTQAYDSFKASVDSATYPALLWVDQNGAAEYISYGPRYYDECGETIDVFLDFYSLGITTALNDALATWLWTNTNLWSGTNYNYALNWKGYECEAGGFLQIALMLLHDDPSLPDTQNLLTDVENRFLAEQFSSPQWLDGVVCHMADYNSELRLENTVMAWAAIFGSYGELSNTYQTDVQDMLTGTGATTTPAWLQLLQSSLCGSNFPYILEHSDDSGPSNDSTATGADLLFLLGIVPQTATLAVPLEENSYEYIYNILDPDLFNINLTTNVITVSLATAGTLNFQFNQTVLGSFSTPGIYTVQFSPDWNTIVNITFVSNLPSNRQYMYTSSLSYCITSSADVNSIISPLGNVVVNANFSQTFTYSAKSGYTVTSVLVDGSSVPITGSYAFNDVQANHTISVTSTLNPMVTISSSGGANGVISPSGLVSVDYGGNQSFVVTPDVGYYIASIMIDGSPVPVLTPSGQTISFTNVESNHTLTATFAVITFNITVSAGANGDINPTGNVSVNYGGNQTFTINPNAGYHIDSITANGTSVAVTSPSSQTYQFNEVLDDSSLTATFAINTYMIAATQASNGVIAPSTSTVDYGGASSFSVTPATGYYIASITVDGSPLTVSSPSGQTVQFADVQATHTITANFAINTYNITATAGSNGSISPAGNVSVNYGSSQSFTIMASAGYHIAEVVADGVSQGAVSSYTFTNVQADHAITANFAINIYNITASAGTNGAISPSKSISVDYGGSQTFNITANTGYYIVDVRVNGSSVGAVSSYTFNNVKSDYTISVTFALSPAIYGIAAAAAIVGILTVALVLRKRKKDQKS